MSKSLSLGFTDTAGVTAKTLTMPAINFATDYSVQSESASEVILVNTTSSMDQPTTIRIATRDVPDVYKGQNISTALIGPARAGIEVLVESRFTHKVTESTTGEEYVGPDKVGITLRFPKDGNLTGANMLSMVLRSIAAVFEQGDNSDIRLNGLIRGIKKPAVLR